MAKSKKFDDIIASAGASEVKEKKPDSATEIRTELTAAEVVAEASDTTQRIDGAADQVVADIGPDPDNRDIVEKVEAKAEASKTAVAEVVEAPVTPEATLDYTQAQSWQEFFEIVKQELSLVDAELLRDRIEAYRRSEISLEEVPLLNAKQKKVLASFVGYSDRVENLVEPSVVEVAATPPEEVVVRPVPKSEIPIEAVPKRAAAPETPKPATPETPPVTPETTERERVKNEIENIPKVEWQEIMEDIRGFSGDYLAGRSDEDIAENAEFARVFLSGEASINPDYLTKSEKAFLTKFFREYLEQVEARNKAKENADSAEEGPETKELPTDLEQARIQYIKALRKRKAAFSTKRKVGIGDLKESAAADFEAIINNYEQLKKQAFLTELKEAGVESDEINEVVVNKYLEFLKTEEAAIDNLASSADRSRLQKFQAWWKRNWKLRTAVGVGMMGLGGAMALTGVGAGVGATAFGIGRGVMSGAGTYMGAEATLDIRTGFLGQKGLIDEVVGSSINIKKLQKKPTKTNIDKAIKDNVFAEYSIDDLREEIARLRVMSLSKGVALENAGRFGEDQAPLVKNLLETYNQKLKEQMIVAGRNKVQPVAEAGSDGPRAGAIILGETLSSHIDGNIKDNTDAVVDELDKQRVKDMSRHAVSAALGLTVGTVVGTKAWAKVEHAKPSDGQEWNNIKKLFPHEETIKEGGAGLEDPFKVAMASQVESPSFNNIVEVHKGDTVWALAKEQLHQRLGTQFDSLDEARKTYLIDAIKDKVAANPAVFGLNHDIDSLRIGEHVDFTAAFKDPSFLKEIQAHASQLDQAALANIIHNNEALQEAARHGVHITTENVDQVAASVKEHGADMLNPDGSVREAVKVVQEVVVAGPEAGVVKTAAEIAKETADKFVAAPEASYSSEVFTAAKTAGSLDTVFNKLVTVGDPKQIEHFVNDWAQAEGLSDNKREIFLGSLTHHDKLELGLGGQVQVGDGVKILAENLKAFDATVLNTSAHTVGESVKAFEALPKEEWAAVKVGETYALVKRVVSHTLIIHKSSWLVSFDADHTAEMTISNKDSLTRIVTNKTFGSSIVTGVKKVISATLDKHPPAMS